MTGTERANREERGGNVGIVNLIHSDPLLGNTEGSSDLLLATLHSGISFTPYSPQKIIFIHFFSLNTPTEINNFYFSPNRKLVQTLLSDRTSVL